MKYIIKYRSGDRDVKVIREAVSSLDAVTKLTDQYGWSWRLSLLDADTHGKEWCDGLIDPDGGINYNYYVICSKDVRSR